MQQPCKQEISADIFNYISKVAQNSKLECYVIGGFVHDFILKKGTAKDIDVISNGIDLAKNVAKLLLNKRTGYCNNAKYKCN